MQFSLRAAIIIAVFCATSLAGSGTPGFAIEPDRSVITTSLSAYDHSTPANVPTPALVPPPAASGLTQSIASDDDQEATLDSAADAQRAYATLAAAIDAQPVPDSVDGDLACLAGAIYFEAKGESLAGQLAVAQVVMNRTTSGRFPSSICSVVTQRGQFSFVRGGHMPSIAHGNASYRRALAIAQVAMDKAWESPVANALYFHARRVSPGWRLTRVAAIGGHIFYR
ncbi:cell wall hydrolase [Sphingomonas sp. 28-63-12]|uniref:cell wall hydrolase n=1 Tax=Sphingomonas sp. 28-63-12 TaxID=1970434 RepID=UPI000BC74C09|nr:MAG: hypothetical protein B7Y47_05585 [Sphingomonas sp. 28-63-12]